MTSCGLCTLRHKEVYSELNHFWYYEFSEVLQRSIKYSMERCLETWHFVLWMCNRGFQKVSFSKKIIFFPFFFLVLFCSQGFVFGGGTPSKSFDSLLSIIRPTRLITLHVFIAGSVIRVFRLFTWAIFTSLKLTVISIDDLECTLKTVSVLGIYITSK